MEAALPKSHIYQVRTGPIIPWNLPISARQYMANVWAMSVCSYDCFKMDKYTPIPCPVLCNKVGFNFVT